MMRLHIGIYLCILLCSVFPGEGDAQTSSTPFILEQFLPEHTLAVCVFPNPLEMFEMVRQLPLMKGLLHNASLQPFQRVPSGHDARTKLSLKSLWQIFSAPLLSGENMQDKTRSLLNSPAAVAWVKKEHVAFIIDVRGMGDGVKDTVETKFINIIQTSVPSTEFRIESYAGVESYVLMNEQFQLYYTVIQDIFLFTFDSETLEELLSNLQPAIHHHQPEYVPTSSLFTTASYRTGFEKIMRDMHHARLYLNVRQIWLEWRSVILTGCSEPLLGSDAILLNFLDHYPVTHLFWTVYLEERGGYEQILFQVDSKYTEKSSYSVFSHLFSSLVETGNGQFSSDQFVPAHALYYGAIRSNIINTWQHIRQGLQHSSNSLQQAPFFSWLSKIEESLSINLEHEFLPALGQEIAIACFDEQYSHGFSASPPSLEHFPFVVFIQVAHQDVVIRVLNQLISLSPAHQPPDIMTFEIPGIITPVTVHLAFIRDFLVLSVSRAMLQEIITTSLQGGSLASRQDYQRLSALFPASLYAKGYIQLKGVIQRLRQFQHQHAIPDQEKSSGISSPEETGGLMWSTTVVHDGFLTTSFSPMGGLVFGMAMHWLLE